MVTNDELIEKLTEKLNLMDEQSDDSSASCLLQIMLNTREQAEVTDKLIHNQIEVKDQLIDKLHKELEFYKQDSADKFVNQLMKAIIKIRKDMKKKMEADFWDSFDEKDLRREYGYIFDDITDLLEQQNVDAYTSKPGDRFDGTIHQPKMEVTDDETLDKTIKESISDGYKKGEKVLIPERVIVYQYKSK